MFSGNKRGMTTLQRVLGIVVLIVLVATALFMFVRNTVDDTTFWKNYYAKDTALIVELLHASSGDTDINYNAWDSSKLLQFFLRSDRMDIYDYNPEVSVDRQLATPFRFAHNDNISVETNNISSTYFRIVKRDDKILLMKDALKASFCPTLPITSSNISSKKFFIDSSNQNSLSLIAGALRIYFQRAGATIVFSKDDADVSLSLQSHNEPKNILRFYYANSIERRQTNKLTCMIKNKMVQSLPDHFAATESEPIINGDVDREVVNSDKIGLYIEFGSELELGEFSGKEHIISEQIGKTVEEFFK